MPVDHIRYDILAQEALRGVVRTVLADVAKKGLPGEHHFKITFTTAAPGVRLSERMRTQYPETMTIVMQHQFWDLVVGDDAFEVGLSFGGVPERLAVPFDAIPRSTIRRCNSVFSSRRSRPRRAARARLQARRPTNRRRPELCPSESAEPDALPAPADGKAIGAGSTKRWRRSRTARSVQEEDKDDFCVMFIFRSFPRKRESSNWVPACAGTSGS